MNKYIYANFLDIKLLSIIITQKLPAMNEKIIVEPDSNKSDLISFLADLYMDACRIALKSQYSVEVHKQSIYKRFSQTKFFYQEVKQIIQYEEQDFIADLLQVAQDFRQVNKNHSKSFQKFNKRSSMHFGGQHFKNLQKYNPQSSAKSVKNVLSWYQNEGFHWSQQRAHHFTNNVYPSCLYMMGLTKGNGVLIDGKYVISCAHIFQSEQEKKLMKIRCFSTGAGGYGIVRAQNSGLYKNQDVCFGNIIAYQGPELSKIQLKLIQPLLQFKQFQPLSCLQVGLLFVPDECLQTFQTFQGFIERNQYENIEDLSLNKDMGLLVHNCYGMWGTSGSPLWSKQGELIGIHNAWNDKGHNVSMMVRDDDQNQCRVIKQYQRRAISSHVLINLFLKWINLPKMAQIDELPLQLKEKKIRKIKKTKK